MKKMVIFDPAMCCSTGVCGPSVDENLLRVSTVINKLKKKDIVVERHNLANDPKAFVENELINQIIDSEGTEALPITTVDGEVVKKKEYPTNDEFCSFLDIPKAYLDSSKEQSTKKCCCGKGNCC